MPNFSPLFLAVALAGCGGSSPPVPPVNPSWRGVVPSSSWAITQGSFPGPLVNSALDFRPGNPSATYLSYVETPLPVSLYGASSYSLTYTFTGGSRDVPVHQLCDWNTGYDTASSAPGRR